MPKKINIVDQKFGRLLVVEATAERKRKNIVWKCLCDCGNFCYKITADLVGGRIRSCGCLFDDFSKTLRLPPGEYGLNQLFRKYKGNAKERGLVFDLSKEDFARMTKINCYYCGAKPQAISQPNTLSIASTAAVENGTYIYNGLDRVDNDVGYIISNVVSCCENCNRAKLTMSQNDFILLVNRIAHNHPMVL
jgi:hypothetical protein